MGRLVLVATPLGNLGDLAPRAIETLAAADRIACEDTRRTRKLLDHAGIDSKPMIVANEHTEYDVVDRVLGFLASGELVALVSDAGLPAISDPGRHLVAAAAAAGFVVSVVPGPTAGAAVVAISGFASERWVFEGFLPRKGADRSERLLEAVDERRTMVFYEAPHRIERTLQDLANMLGPARRCVIGRELTKLHEEVWRGDLEGARAWAEAGVKGELVIVVEGAPPSPEPTDDELVDELREAIASGESRRDAAAEVATRFGVGRRRAYELTHRIDGT